MNKLIVANPEITMPVVDKVFAFEDTVKAYEYLESGAHVSKVVIRVPQDEVGITPSVDRTTL